LPDDVAQVCQSREPFFFLREDILDLAREQKHQQQTAADVTTTASSSNNNNTTKQQANNTKAAIGTKPLTAYFAAMPKK
jgi:hypothetical protein